MADNVSVTAGTGTTLLTDEKTVNGTTGHVQRVTTGSAPSGAYGAVSVTTSATTIKAANYERTQIDVTPTNGDIYIGFDSSVTTSTGFLVPSGGSWSNTSYLGAVYAIAAATTNVRYLETY